LQRQGINFLLGTVTVVEEQAGAVPLEDEPLAAALEKELGKDAALQEEEAVVEPLVAFVAFGCFLGLSHSFFGIVILGKPADCGLMSSSSDSLSTRPH
jgi:hypothetical protein